MLGAAPVCATLPFNGLVKAKEFYSSTLGLKLVEGSPEEGWLLFEAGKGTKLQVFESDSDKSNDTGATFEVLDLEKTMGELRGKGIVFEEYDLPEMKTVNGIATMEDERAAWFKDPAGNVLCMHQKK